MHQIKNNNTMKRLLKTILILTICAWIGNDSSLLNASNRNNLSRINVEEIQQNHRPKRPIARNQIMNDRDFQFMYKIIKKKSFNDDRLEILSVGVLDNYFSCRQCAKLISLFSFDSNKLEALEIMAEHIADRDNMDLILDAFSFDSNKDKAFKLLRPKRR